MMKKIHTSISVPAIIAIMCLSLGLRAQYTPPTVTGRWMEASVQEIKRFEVRDHTDTTVTRCDGCFINFGSDMHYHYEAMHGTTEGIYTIHGNTLKETTPGYQEMVQYDIITLTDHQLVTQHAEMAADSSQYTVTTWSFTR